MLAASACNNQADVWGPERGYGLAETRVVSSGLTGRCRQTSPLVTPLAGQVSRQALRDGLAAERLRR